MSTNQKSLSSIMDFDHIVTVHEDGSVTDGPNSISAPELWEGKLDSSEWELLSGFSSQAGSGPSGRYMGPIMHNSEFIGGYLEDHILSHPGIYVAIVSNYFPEEDDGETEMDGWAVARLIKNP